MSTKKSILVYFDSYPMLVALPFEQRGLIFTVLLVYGERLSRENTDLEEIMEQFPRLTPEARAVCGFMGANISRDTQKWLSRQQRGSVLSPVQRRRGGPAPLTPKEKEASERRVAEDMERTRRLMEQFKKEQDA